MSSEPVSERRRWVRLCSACNNRCAFCLDRGALDGRLRPFDELVAELREGRAEGAARAVLSGVEPTLHPRLPDLIRTASELGYGWVQIISNGRRLGYPAYLRALVEAGLREVTFSLHGSGPEVHDDVVGVPGAFEQAFAGLRAALDAGLIVSVDIVLHRRNLADAPTLVHRTLEAGVREYDVLWLTPFGAAAEHLSKPRGFFLGPSDAPAVHRVLDEARAGGAVVWTNRMPLAYLEGREELAQDPSKLEDELRGRRDMIDPLIEEGRPLPCRDPARCPRCPFDAYCAVLHEAVAVARGERRPAVLRWDPAATGQDDALPRFRLAAAWLRTERPPAAWGEASRRAAREARALRLEAPPGVLAASLPLVPPRTVLALRRPPSARPLPAAVRRTAHELVVPLTAAAALRVEPETLGLPPRRLVPALPDAPTGRRDGWPFQRDSTASVRRWLRAAGAAEGLPPCLGGRKKARGTPEPFDLGWLDPSGRIDRYAVLRDFVAERQRAWSLRCSRCAARKGCRGLAWEMARTVGLRILRPFPHA